MKIKFRAAALIFLLSTSSGFAIEPVYFTPGLSQAEFIERYGPANVYYALRPGRHFSETERPIAERIYGPLMHGYYRKTQRNEYEIRVEYAVDETTSRLHPTPTTYRAWIVVDKPAPAFDVLNDLVEARDLCGGKCSLLGSSFAGPQLLVVSNGNSQEQSLAFKIATAWASSTSLQPGSWFRCLDLTSERWSLLGAPAWLTDPISEVKINVTSPSMQKSALGRQPIGLGYWSPPTKARN